MLFKAIFAVAAVLEFFFVPWFLKAMWPKKNKKSLVIKMICSGLFMIMFLAAAEIGGNWSVFTILMLGGAVSGFIGDYLLHVKVSTRFFLYGLLSFMIGHLFYIASFTWELFKGGDFEYGWRGVLSSVLLIAVIMTGIILGAKKMKVHMHLKLLMVSALTYSVVLITMFVQALTLAVFCFAYKMENRIPILICLVAGALCFVLSDGSLGIIQFARRKKNYPLKIFNIVTYFAAQMLLASTLLFLS